MRRQRSEERFSPMGVRGWRHKIFLKLSTAQYTILIKATLLQVAFESVGKSRAVTVKVFFFFGKLRLLVDAVLNFYSVLHIILGSINSPLPTETPSFIFHYESHSLFSSLPSIIQDLPASCTARNQLISFGCHDLVQFNACCSSGC